MPETAADMTGPSPLDLDRFGATALQREPFDYLIVPGFLRAEALPAIEQIENQRAILKRRGAVIKARRELQKEALKLSLYYRDADGQPLVPSVDRVPAALPTTHPARATATASTACSPPTT